MNKRISKLYKQSIETKPYITSERAELVTNFYQNIAAQHISAPVLRGMVLKHIMENKSLCVNDGELIVGERGPAPKATPTFPEICLHSLADLEILNSREKVFFKVDEETRKIYAEKIIPFWQGKTNRDRLLNLMSAEWIAAYQTGVFTEFQEQRGPGQRDQLKGDQGNEHPCQLLGRTGDHERDFKTHTGQADHPDDQGRDMGHVQITDEEQDIRH